MSKIIHAGIRGAGYQRLVKALQDHQPFRTSGALSADPCLTYSLAGKLNAEEYAAWKRDRDHVTYVVYSYTTPIAWVTDDHVHIVDQKFSLTTSRHQGIVRAWLGQK